VVSLSGEARGSAESRAPSARYRGRKRGQVAIHTPAHRAFENDAIGSICQGEPLGEAGGGDVRPLGQPEKVELHLELEGLRGSGPALAATNWSSPSRFRRRTSTRFWTSRRGARARRWTAGGWSWPSRLRRSTSISFQDVSMGSAVPAGPQPLAPVQEGRAPFPNPRLEPEPPGPGRYLTRFWMIHSDISALTP
jgi:hypothetical protein